MYRAKKGGVPCPLLASMDEHITALIHSNDCLPRRSACSSRCSSFHGQFTGYGDTKSFAPPVRGAIDREIYAKNLRLVLCAVLFGVFDPLSNSI